MKRILKIADGTPHGIRRCTRALVTAGCLLLLLPVLLYAHLALVSSRPAADSELEEAPAEIYLTFTEPIELEVSRVDLIGPRGEVELGILETNEDRLILRAPVTGELQAGGYVVRWQAVGRDAHPVRGEFGFTIQEGATGLVQPISATEPAPHAPQTAQPPAPPVSSFDAQSPLYAVVRALTYLGILGTTGAVGFILLMLVMARAARESVVEQFAERTLVAASTLGLLASLFAVIALPLRLQAQSHALFGEGISADLFGRVIGSSWGLSWTTQAAGAAVALIGFLVARQLPRTGLVLAGVGALGLSVSPGLSGHAATVATWTVPALISDAIHVLGAGIWLGTLLAMVIVGIPMIRRIAAEERSRVLHVMVTAFSPIALTAAALVLATGAFASFLHLNAPADLWTTPYGRLLVAKLLLVMTVGAAGAYNWRRLQPRSGEPGAELRLRRSAGIELTAAALVIALTSILVAVPPPADAERATEAALTLPDE